MAAPRPVPFPQIPFPPPDISCNQQSWALYSKKAPYGRWNNTNSNYKLFPLTLCRDICGNTVRHQTRNLFKNTAMRWSQRQVYSYLMRNRIFNQ